MRGKTLTAALVLALGIASPAAAQTINVHNTHDDGNGSLRKALENANFGDTVKAPAGHYVLTTGQIEVTTEVKLVGAGARKTVIDANRDGRVININYGAPGTVRFSGVTIREGDTDGMESGGGINVNSPTTKLLLKKVAVLDNRVITNTDSSNGGGVYSSGDVVVKQSLFAGNHAYNGGAVAGIGDIRASDSTFYGNFAGNPTFNGDGGAFDNAATLTDSTVVGNACFNGEGCGGGLYASGATLKGTLIAENTAYLANGMPAGSAGNPGSPDNCSGVATDLGHNLDDHHDCMFAAPGDISGQNAKVGSLRNNGGATDTLGFGEQSPAFNGGAASCTHKDQRGVRRPQGSRCDIGAFELGL